MRQSLLMIGAFLLGSASAAYAGAESAQRTITIYDPTQIAFDRYEVVKRIGIEDRQSAFRIRSYPTVEAARQALADAAARAGADGIVNLVCLDQTDRLFNPRGHFCYGNAIRVRR